MGAVTRDMYGNRTSGRVDSAYRADGTPKYLKVFDGGAACWDRYTAAFTRTADYRGTRDVPFIAITEHGSTYHGVMLGRARPGRLVKFADLSAPVQRAIVDEYRAIWG